MSCLHERLIDVTQILRECEITEDSSGRFHVALGAMIFTDGVDDGDIGRVLVLRKFRSHMNPVDMRQRLEPRYASFPFVVCVWEREENIESD